MIRKSDVLDIILARREEISSATSTIVNEYSRTYALSDLYETIFTIGDIDMIKKSDINEMIDTRIEYLIACHKSYLSVRDMWECRACEAALQELEIMKSKIISMKDESGVEND